jgi:hypothetical protein
MQSSHRKHYTSLARSAFDLPKLRVQPRTERAKPYVLAHALAAREAADILDCSPGEIEVLVTSHTLVGRNVRLALSEAEVTARGRLWIVCAACVADFRSLTPEARQAAITAAWEFVANLESE